MSNKIITDQDLSFWKKKFLMYAKFWLWNPVAFIYMLGIAKILPYQAEILQSVVKNKRTMIRSGHGAGKTFIMSLAACWWLCFHWIKGEGCSVVVTSPSASNLTTVFWAQFSKCMDLVPEYLKNSFTITAEACYENEDSFGWRLDLRTARKDNPDAMQGQHNVLFLIDEWSGVPIEIYRVIEGSMSDEGSRILAIGNALRRSGWGYEGFTKNKKLWKLIHIDCEIYTSDKSFTTKWTDIFGVEHEDENKGRVDPKEVQKWLDISGGNRDGYDYMIRVRGEFPSAGKNQFIPLNKVQPCFKQSYYEEQNKSHTLGLDPATGGDGDEIAMVHRWGKNLMSILTWHDDNTRKIAYKVEEWLRTDGAKFKFKFLAIDSIGDGQGVYDSLLEMKQQGKLPNVEIVYRFKASNEANNKDRFDRKRDEVWEAMKVWYINEKPHFNPQYTSECEALREETVALTSDFNTRGALKIESKKDMRKRGVKSPNIADALSMTFARSDDTYREEKLDRYQQALRDYAKNQPTTDWRAL